MADWKITILLVVCSFMMEVFAMENDWTDDCTAPCRCKWMSGRKMADCSASELTKLPVKLSSEIQSVDLSLNRISRLMSDDFTRIGLANLQKIYMKDCQITEIHKDAFRGLKILIELDLSNNQIHAVHADTFRDNEKLRVLMLNGNPIKKLEDGLFSNHIYLQTVELSECSISSIGHKTFTYVPVLSTLKLDGNELTNLKASTFDSLKKLRSLEIRNNPWTCDCSLRAFRDWIIDSNLYTLPTTCKEPPVLHGRLWADVSSDQFACKPSISSPATSGSKIYVSAGDTVTLPCRVTGDPKPQTHWVYNSRIIENNTSGFYTADGSSKYMLAVEENRDPSWLNLTINRLRIQDEGDYSCVATSAGGIDERNMTVLLKQGSGGPIILGADQMTGDVWLLLLCLIFGIICALVLLIVLCCICCRRNNNNDAAAISKKHNVNCSNGDVNHVSGRTVEFGETDQRKNLLTTINPVQKPPRKYGDSPTPANDVNTELTELMNRNLLDDASVIGSSSITGESVDERRSSDSTDRLSSRHSQYTYLTPERTRLEYPPHNHEQHHHHHNHHPPDLLAFPSVLRGGVPVLVSSPAASYSSANDLKTNTLRRNLVAVGDGGGSPLHSPVYSSSYGTLPYNRSQSPFSPTRTMATGLGPPPTIISQRQGYVTIPRRPRVPSWSSAPTPTLLEDSSLAKAEPVYDNLGPRTTADGSSVLSLPKSLMNESASRMKHRPLPHTPASSGYIGGSSTLPHNSKLLASSDNNNLMINNHDNHVVVGKNSSTALNSPDSYSSVIDDNIKNNENNEDAASAVVIIKPLPLNESQLLPISTTASSHVKNDNNNNISKRRPNWSQNNKGLPETGILKRPPVTSNNNSAISGNSSNSGGIVVKPKVPPRPPPKPKKNGPLFEDEGEDGTEV